MISTKTLRQWREDTLIVIQMLERKRMTNLSPEATKLHQERILRLTQELMDKNLVEKALGEIEGREK